MSQVLFEYSFQPPNVFLGTTTDMKLVIKNPDNGSTIHFDGGNDKSEIDVTFPIGKGENDLSPSLNFTADSLTTGFTCGLASNGDYFRITTSNAGGTDLAPGSSIEINFVNVVVNSQEGTATVQIEELVTMDTAQTSVNINKQQQELAVIPWLDDYVVGEGQFTTLRWISMANTAVEVSGFESGSGTKSFPVEGEQPYTGHVQVTVPIGDAQRDYTLVATTPSKRSAPQVVALTVNPPFLVSFTSNKSGTLGVDDNVVLSWEMLYAYQVSLNTPLTTYNSVISPRTETPGQDLVQAYKFNYSNMPDQVTYTLTGQGFKKPATGKINFKLAPVGLAYFKFGTNEDGNLSGIKFATNPPDWIAVEASIAEDPATFTIHQPGGTANVYYLGDNDTVHPQIQYFEATDKGSNNFELSWITKNLRTLTLNPGNYNIGGSEINKGSKTLTINSSNTYTLTGTADNGETIVSQLYIEVG